MRYFFDQDDSCHWYMIPWEMRDEWIEMSNEISKFSEDSDEFYDLVDKFEAKFGHHRTGGGISHISFENPD